MVVKGNVLATEAVGAHFMVFIALTRFMGMNMTFIVCYYAAKSILDQLETTEFSLGQTKIEFNNPV